MDIDVERLVLEAMTLPTTARAELAHRLIASLDDGADSQVDDAGLAEAARRLAQIEAGEVQPISADELFGRVRRRLAK